MPVAVEVVPHATGFAMESVNTILNAIGFGGIGGLGALGFTKLRTEVRLYREENQKDHRGIVESLDKLNGAARKARSDIDKIDARCQERHK